MISKVLPMVEMLQGQIEKCWEGTYLPVEDHESLRIYAVSVSPNTGQQGLKDAHAFR